MSLTEKIKSQYGTLKHYAKVKKINYGSLRLVACGRGISKPVIAQLKKDGFIK